MLIVSYWCMFHRHAQLKISLVDLFTALLCLNPPLPLPDPPLPLICLLSLLHAPLHFSHFALFTFFFIPRSLLPPLPRTPSFRWSHRCVSFIDVCLRSGVDEQGALGRGVNPLSALVLIGGAGSRVTEPTREKSDFIMWFYNSDPLPGGCSQQTGLLIGSFL